MHLFFKFLEIEYEKKNLISEIQKHGYRRKRILQMCQHRVVHRLKEQKNIKLKGSSFLL